MIARQPMPDSGCPDPDADELVVAVTKMAEVFGIEREVLLREMAEQVRRIATFMELRRLHDVRGH
jgi:hypothetical protein